MASTEPIDRIVQSYAASPRTAQILAACTVPARTEASAQRVQLKNLAGALESFLIAGCYRKAGGHTLVVAADKEEAAYILFPVGYPANDATVPDMGRKPLSEISVWKG